MKTNGRNKSLIYWKRDFTCKKCGSKEFVFGEQVYSRSCGNCGVDESFFSFSFFFKSFFNKTKIFLGSFF
jgi:hypothetical protein